jgi:threonine dehydrogenase-like Zn-dependent dehydrogenase
MGAARVVRINPHQTMAHQAARVTAPVVFEAGGTAEAMDLALRAAAPGGIVAFIGIPDGDSIAYPVHVARRKELTVLNVRRSNGELAEAARLLAAGRLHLTPMLTHRGPLGATGRFFERVRLRSGGVVKAIVVP